VAKSPWKDRTELLKDISSFTMRNGAFFRQNAKRMSDLFELSVYNDTVKFYRRKRYDVSAENLMKDGTFKYKLSTSGLKENFSFFRAKKVTPGKVVEEIEIHHNIRLQSAHDDHIYFTSDVSVTRRDGVTTKVQKNGRKHSFVQPKNLITFLEVKHMNPFPEVLFSFSGIVLEVKPDFILDRGGVDIGTGHSHLTPSLVFSGIGGAHVESVAEKLMQRYGYNVIRGLFANKGRIYANKSANTFDA
jgi:hypothetical protein